VTFRQPFVLSGVDGTQRPGAYDVDTDEESIDTQSFLAYPGYLTPVLAEPAIADLIGFRGAIV
jgi:hypothetical protein